MRKYRSYFFLLLLAIGFLVFAYSFLKKDPKNVQIIEINFISNHSVVEKMNDFIPDEIKSFSSIYNQNDSIDYISRISFKRTDIGNYYADSLNNYKFRIDHNLKIEDADKMFSEENKTIKATEKMFLNSEGTNNSILNDTSEIRHFYLVPINDPRAHNSNKYFDKYQNLKKYIDEELKIETLFKDKRNNVITIILDNQNVQVTEPEKAPELLNPDNTKIKSDDNNVKVSSKKEEYKPQAPPKSTIEIYSLFKKISKNKVQWSNDLQTHAQKITIVFDNGDKKITADVTNMNSYTFDSGDKDFDGVEATVTLLVDIPGNIKIKDALSFKMKVVCSI